MITFNDLIEGHSGPRGRTAYAAASSWWTHDIQRDAKEGPPIQGHRGISLDASGAPVYEASTLEFLRDAEEHPEHYGEGGLNVFMFAHHQNSGGRCFKTWPEARTAWIEAGRPDLVEAT